MKISPMLAAVALCAAGGISLAQNTDENKVSASEFVKQAGAGGVAEVQMGELGARKARNSEVRAFAKKMVTDHNKANGELVTLTKGKGAELPSAPDTMHKAMLDKFEQQDADKDFDRAYMQQMIEDHKSAIELFETAADDAQLDADLRAYAKKTLPTLRDHLKEAQTIESKLSK